MKALLTGSSGYIGSILTPVLQSSGYTVKGLDRQIPSGPSPDEFVHVDLLDEGAMDGVLDDVDLVLHLAAARVDWGLPDEDYATLAGLILYESQMVPQAGQAFVFHGYRFDVVRRQRNQITLIRVTPLEDDGAAEEV